MPTEGTCSFSACEEAASVVTVRWEARFETDSVALCLRGAKHLGARTALLIMMVKKELPEEAGIQTS